MLLALALALIAIAGGTLLTYLYDEGVSLVSRLSAGAVLGFGAFGLLAFLYASFLGLTWVTLILATASVALPLALLRAPKRRVQVFEDTRNGDTRLRRAAGIRACTRP